MPLIVHPRVYQFNYCWRCGRQDVLLAANAPLFPSPCAPLLLYHRGKEGNGLQAWNT